MCVSDKGVWLHESEIGWKRIKKPRLSYKSIIQIGLDEKEVFNCKTQIRVPTVSLSLVISTSQSSDR